MSQTTTAPAAPKQRSSVFDHPLGFWFFFCGGCAERCSYYGMKAILLLYMIRILDFQDGYANRVMSFFMAACYLLPLAGGWVADKILGNYRTIVFFSIPYVIGQGILAIASLHEPKYLYLSLGLLVLGSGMIKPNISTLMGLTYDQRRPGRAALRSDAFALFYASINIGSAVSSFCVPLIRNACGGDTKAYAYAFLLPTILMALSLVIFALGRPFYATTTIHRREHRTPEERRERMAVLRRMLGLFLVVVFFWSIFDQASSTWVLFSRDYLHLKVLGYQLAPDQIQTLNPVLILILLPPITMMWHVLARFGLDLKPTSKMLIGFVVTAATMGVIAWSGFYGAARIMAGAPAAVESAEKAAAAAAKLAPSTAAVENAARELSAALAKIREAKAGEKNARTPSEAKAALIASQTAQEALKSARQGVKQTGADAVALLLARDAAVEALRTARAAFDAASRTAGNPAARTEAEKRVSAQSQTAKIAAEAANEAKDLSLAVARELYSKGSAGSSVAKKTGPDLTLCTGAATQASAAASAARSSIAAAVAGNQRAARINAAVAGVDAADAAVAAAKLSAQFAQVDVPAAAIETEAATTAARISLLWQIIPYILITIGEVCISVVGLELAFAAAPPAMKTFMTACWLLTIFFGGVINGFITPLYNETFLGISLTPDWYFLWFAVAMVPVTLAFMLMSRRFNRPAE
jgi:dipeptide/tripeptide permease